MSSICVQQDRSPLVLLFTTMVLTALLAGCRDAADPLAPPSDGLARSVVEGPAPIPGHFIILLRDSVDASLVAHEHGVAARFVYRGAVNGFAGRMSDAARSGLKRDRRVLVIEQDMTIQVSEVEPAATWGLDRLDQRARPLDGVYTYANAGAGVTAYIVDTGIWYTHEEYRGRAEPGFDAYNGEPYGPAVDCHGHGTHVAGTVGGATYGVAKGVQLVGVRVLDCAGSGSWSTVIAGLDWILANARRPAVVNMSLGGPASSIVDAAVARLTSAGITVVAAAGNSNADACESSPARAPAVLTIGASTDLDARASFSNWGNCVDWFAPGVYILSANKGSDTRTAFMSGTSMAAPHATGVAAMFLQRQPAASPEMVFDTLFNWTTKNVVTDAKSGNAHLLYSLPALAAAPPPTDTVPTDTVKPPPTDTVKPPPTDTVKPPPTDTVKPPPTDTVKPPPTDTVPPPPTDTVKPPPTDTVKPPPADPPPPPAITLVLAGTKVKAVRTVTLSWAGAASSRVDIYRDDKLVLSTENDGEHSDLIPGKGGGSFVYKVCEAGTSVCSAPQKFTF